MENIIGTSINIEKGRLEKFRRAAEVLHLTETQMLSLLLQRSRRLFGNKAVTNRAVKYQRGCNSADYEIVHIELSSVDYEFATGRRYLFKISVSLLIRLVIDRFLEKIIREWLQNPIESAEARQKYTTNFHYKFFRISHLSRNNHEFWVIPWPTEE